MNKQLIFFYSFILIALFLAGYIIHFTTVNVINTCTTQPINYTVSHYGALYPRSTIYGHIIINTEEGNSIRIPFSSAEKK